MEYTLMGLTHAGGEVALPAYGRSAHKLATRHQSRAKAAHCIFPDAGGFEWLPFDIAACVGNHNKLP